MTTANQQILREIKNDTNTNDFNIKAFSAMVTGMDELKKARDAYLDRAIKDGGDIDIFWIKEAIKCHICINTLRKA